MQCVLKKNDKPKKSTWLSSHAPSRESCHRKLDQFGVEKELRMKIIRSKVSVDARNPILLNGKVQSQFPRSLISISAENLVTQSDKATKSHSRAEVAFGRGHVACESHCTWKTYEQATAVDSFVGACEQAVRGENCGFL